MSANAEISSTLISGTDVTIPSTIQPYFQVSLTDLPTPTAYALYLNGRIIKSGSWTFPQNYEARIPLTNLVAGTYTFYMTIGFIDGQTVTTNQATLIILSSSSSATPTFSVDKIISGVGGSTGITTGTGSLPSSPASSPFNLSLQMKYGIIGGIILGLSALSYVVYEKVVKK